jgi:hypothetical protein
MSRPGFLTEIYLDTTVDTTKTSAVQVPTWARWGMVYIPTCDNAAITLEMALNEDIGYPTAVAAELLASDDSYWKVPYSDAEENQVLGANTGDRWVDISNYVRAMPKDAFLRVVFGATQNQAAKQTLYISFRGA